MHITIILLCMSVFRQGIESFIEKWRQWISPHGTRSTSLKRVTWKGTTRVPGHKWFLGWIIGGDIKGGEIRNGSPRWNTCLKHSSLIWPDEIGKRRSAQTALQDGLHTWNRPIDRFHKGRLLKIVSFSLVVMLGITESSLLSVNIRKQESGRLYKERSSDQWFECTWSKMISGKGQCRWIRMLLARWPATQ